MRGACLRLGQAGPQAAPAATRLQAFEQQATKGRSAARAPPISPGHPQAAKKIAKRQGLGAALGCLPQPHQGCAETPQRPGKAEAYPRPPGPAAPAAKRIRHSNLAFSSHRGCGHTLWAGRDPSARGRQCRPGNISGKLTTAELSTVAAQLEHRAKPPAISSSIPIAPGPRQQLQTKTNPSHRWAATPTAASQDNRPRLRRKPRQALAPRRAASTRAERPQNARAWPLRRESQRGGEGQAGRTNSNRAQGRVRGSGLALESRVAAPYWRATPR